MQDQPDGLSENIAGIPSLPKPGLIVLFGSGETSPTGQKIFEQVLRSLPPSPRLALLETPAGFELNSQQVIGRVGDFFTQRLQNFSPQVEIIPARKRGTPFSPEDPEIVAPLLKANLIFMGPGSPSYAIRQLHGSLAWYYTLARHQLGAALALASAATVAFSAYALPVYEIYKVGEELHWIEGLDFFNLYGLKLVFIPHWNNQEGGAELDTSRCFMGEARFERLMEILPGGMTIIGLDEKTALILDPSRCECRVKGLGKVTVLHTGHEPASLSNFDLSAARVDYGAEPGEDLTSMAKRRSDHAHYFCDGQIFPMSVIGNFTRYHPESDLPNGVWQQALVASRCMDNEISAYPPEEVIQLIQQRDRARRVSDWATADAIRQQVEKLGWQISDTREGTRSKKLSKV